MTYCRTICFILMLIGGGNLLAAELLPLSSLKYDPFEQPAFLKAHVQTRQSTSRTNTPKLQLRSILEAGDESVVNLNGKILMIGDRYQGYQLVEVNKQSATFIKNGEKTKVTLNQ